ncbi:hypothetical protein VC897_03820 [Citrobacter youngae]|uniref:hypothetical protein n=1 Tax=Citrobacter youngae TaxID=133448 RepID=UPI002B229EFA|nr:hypothetical protein [Citrobacter youngae]MEB0863663.1 hypothetical protein [Citrobacter youngae]
MKPSYEELDKKCALQQSKLAALNELMEGVEKACDIAKAGIENLQLVSVPERTIKPTGLSL